MEGYLRPPTAAAVRAARPTNPLDTSRARGLQTSAQPYVSPPAHPLACSLSLYAAQATLPLIEADGGGALVFVSTLAAQRNGPYPYIGYETSKAALCRLSLACCFRCAQ